MAKNIRLELTWIGKEERPRLEPRILVDDPSLSYHAAVKGEKDIFENVLIHGDNLLGLKSLQSDFSNQVKCVYIDPPFNTQQAMPNYEDGLEHSLWLSLIRDRIHLIRALMCEEGTLFVHIDDNEFAYLTVLCDEIFGRGNRISIITFKQGSATGHKSINPGVVTTSNFIVIYAKNKDKWIPNRIFVARGDRDKRYGQYIDNRQEHFAKWRFCTLSNAFARHLNLPERGLKRTLGDEFEAKITEFVHDHANAVIQLARPDYDAVSAAAREMIDNSVRRPSDILQLIREPEHSNMYFKGGQRILFYSDKLKLIDGKYVPGEPLTSIWDDILSNNLHNEGGVEFPKGKKPEGLLKRCIELERIPFSLARSLRPRSSSRIRVG